MKEDEIRLIVTSKPNGENETVLFTEDDESPVAHYLLPGHTPDIDEIIEDTLPSTFPRNFTLYRES